MIKVTDYIIRKLAENDIRHIFMITGGGAMHLNDSIGNNESVEYTCCQHEQACAIAAEGYFRASGKMAGVNVTSGPGGTNTVTGVIGQWLDSIPCIYLSGQVKQQTTISAYPELHLRQLGDQEINIVDIVKPITKYAVMVRDANTIRYHLEKALYLATHGRPGPVWLDIPLDIQAAMIDEAALAPYEIGEDEVVFDKPVLKSLAREVIEHIRLAERPVLLVGHGIRLSGGVKTYEKLADLMNIPILTAISGHDLITSDHPLFYGRPGIVGDRVGNMVVQNADLLIAIGARLGVRQISYNFDSFARAAYRIMVDIDAEELKKPTLRIDLPIHSDAKLFMDEMIEILDGEQIPPKEEWLGWCRDRKNSLPSIFEDNSSHPDYVNYYRFTDRLFENLEPGSTVVLANGTAYTATFQAMKIKKNTRVFANQGCASMGYDVPAAIGASISLNNKPVILISGDGSIQMNIQEFQTIIANRLPIKIFVINNNGYLAIRITQDSYFQGRHYGSEPGGGLNLPNIQAIAQAYGFSVSQIKIESELDEKIREVLSSPGPHLCEVWMDPKQTLFPKLSSVIVSDGSMVSMPLEDMYPFLPRDDFRKHMIIPPLEQSKGK